MKAGVHNGGVWTRQAVTKKLMILVICVPFFTGCVWLSSHHETGSKAAADPQMHSKIQEGHTTKQEVYDLLGVPNFKHFTANEDEVWGYFYSQSWTRPTSYIPVVGTFFGGKESEYHTFVVIFDTNGLVKGTSEIHGQGGGGGVQDLGK